MALSDLIAAGVQATARGVLGRDNFRGLIGDSGPLPTRVLDDIAGRHDIVPGSPTYAEDYADVRRIASEQRRAINAAEAARSSRTEPYRGRLPRDLEPSGGTAPVFSYLLRIEERLDGRQVADRGIVRINVGQRISADQAEALAKGQAADTSIAWLLDWESGRPASDVEYRATLIAITQR